MNPQRRFGWKPGHQRGIDAANKNRVFAWKGIWMYLRLALMSAGRIWAGKRGFPGQ